MSRHNFNAPKLPKELRDKFEAGVGSSSSKRRKTLPRKEQRKLERQQKKQVRRPQVKPRNHHQIADEEDDDDDEEEIADPWADEDSGEELDSALPRKRMKLSPPAAAREKVIVAEKKITPRPSRAVRDALDDDDAEIARLEKKLGIRGKKRGKTEAEDEFGDLLAGIDDAVADESHDKSADEEWLQNKRSRFEEEPISEEEDDDNSVGEDFDENGFSGSDGFEENDSESEDEDQHHTKDQNSHKHHAPVKENPYRPPIASSDVTTQKYIPPSLRTSTNDDQEILRKLRRQLQGLLNRLSDANILSIIKEVEVVLSNNARQHVISSLIDLLITLIADRSSHLDTFIVLHSAFVAGLYGSIGTHFGAQVLERVVTEFQNYYEQQTKERTGSKETSNLIAFIAELYTFQIVAHRLVFDLIRLLLTDLSELNVELLLKIIKNCGVQLRADDPLALKDVVKLVHEAVARKGGEKQVPVRTRYMIETISNIKNNRLKMGPSGSDSLPQHALTLKKIIKNRSMRTTEPLGIGLKDIENAANGGKWWLVGASWNEGHEQEFKNNNDAKEANIPYHDDEGGGSGSEMNVLLTLAKQHRMNTDIRRTIFVTIMSSVDYKDAALRLRSLRLKKIQQFEIPRVLVYLAGAEDKYNPFYRLLAKELCVDHKFRKALGFNLMRTFQNWGETDVFGITDDLSPQEPEIANRPELREIISLAQFYGELLASQALNLRILKMLDFLNLQKQTEAFVEVLLVTVLESVGKQYESNPGEAIARLTDIFGAAKQTPEMVPGLKYFIKNKVRKSSLVIGSRAQKIHLLLCRSALQQISFVESVAVEHYNEE